MNYRKQEDTGIPEAKAKAIRREARFEGIFPGGGGFDRVIPLSSPYLHGDKQAAMERGRENGPDGSEVRALEQEIVKYTGRKYAVALSSGGAALHMALMLAAERLSADEDFDTGRVSDPANRARKDKRHAGCLSGLRVFCQDFAPASAAEAVLREDGEPVFVDVSYEDWSMDPEALERAFTIYPETKIVVMNHAYGFPGQAVEIKRICEAHGAVLIEDASESFGASCFSAKTGTIGDYGILDFGSDRIITGEGGGMLLMSDEDDYLRTKKHVSDALPGMCRRRQNKVSQNAVRTCEAEEADCDYRMNNLIAAVIRTQLPHLDKFIEKKRAIHDRYLDAFEADGLLLLHMPEEGMEPNYGMSCAVCDSGIPFEEVRTDNGYSYVDRHGTASPMEICDALNAFGAEARPVYKPLSMQRDYANCDLVTAEGRARSREPVDGNAVWSPESAAGELYYTAICLPSDPNMTLQEQDTIIEIIRSCFNEKSFSRMDWVEGLEKIS